MDRTKDATKSDSRDRDLGLSNNLFQLYQTNSFISGFLEHFRSALHDIQFHFNISIAGYFSITKDQQYTVPQLLSSAFQHAINIHPGLSVNIATSGSGRPHFRRLSKIPLHRTILFESVPSMSFRDPNYLDSIASRENSRGYSEEDLPLWRAIVLQPETDASTSDFWLLLSWHHSIGDGKSGLAVYHDVVRGIKSFHTKFNPNSIEDISMSRQGQEYIARASTKPLWPALEEIIILPLSQSGKPLAQPSKTKWGGTKIFCQLPVVTKVHVVKVLDEVVVNLLSLCKKNKTTITALLQAALGSVIINLTKAELVTSATAMSLRRFFPSSFGIDDSLMGMWVGSILTDYEEDILIHDDSHEVLWKRAAQDHEHFKKEIAKGDRDLDISQWKNVMDFERVMTEMIGQPRQKSYAITNLNVFRVSEELDSANWRIEDMFFSQSCHVQGSALQACIMTLQDKGMSISFTWQEGVVEQSLIVGVATALGDLLAKL
jgi:hypothetical protein